MKLTEMKSKVLSLIEEINPSSEALTDDPDISAKLNDVINQIMFELARIKKIPKYADEIEVEAGETMDFDRLEGIFGNPVFQIIRVTGAEHELKADSTVIKFSETGNVEIEAYVYPTYITADNEKDYVFELSADALEIMPYGVAADILKSDVSANYGTVYANRYEMMLQRLDTKYNAGMVTFDGGVNI